MRQFTDAVHAAIAQQNWYAALTVALTLPDICGRLEQPNTGSQARYVAWCQTYLEPRYRGSGGMQLLSGRDCYALRCAFLHEGSNDIVNQRAREALDSFMMMAPVQPGLKIHNIRDHSKLHLQVDAFCQDICAGVHDWEIAAAKDAQISDRIAGLMQIRQHEGGTFRI